ALIREEYHRVTRDNVIFEFGLFLGRLGINRTFMLLEEGVSLFSDWDGIKPAKFQRRDNMVSAVGGACQQIMEEMGVATKLKHFSMLPSTSLAVGYYFNFLNRVYEAFEQSDTFTVSERDGKGNYVDVATYPIKNRYPVIEVRIPKNLAELGQDVIKRRTQSFKQIRVNALTRAFPFYIEAELDSNGLPKLFDMPTTLFASYMTSREIFSADFLARENNLAHIMDKEIDNFERTLRLLIPDGFEREYFKFTKLA
ncbi:MAG TPA: nucleotide-binding protein, partial [Flavobacteriales bacterium]|nr:nucleotide-binding protein [Flavobacteriales bacterium]